VTPEPCRLVNRVYLPRAAGEGNGRRVRRRARNGPNGEAHRAPLHSGSQALEPVQPTKGPLSDPAGLAQAGAVDRALASEHQGDAAGPHQVGRPRTPRMRGMTSSTGIK